MPRRPHYLGLRPLSAHKLSACHDPCLLAEPQQAPLTPSCNPVPTTSAKTPAFPCNLFRQSRPRLQSFCLQHSLLPLPVCISQPYPSHPTLPSPLLTTQWLSVHTTVIKPVTHYRKPLCIGQLLCCVLSHFSYVRLFATL